MGELLFSLLGLVGGGLAMYFALDRTRKRVETVLHQQEALAQSTKEAQSDLQLRESKLIEEISRQKENLAQAKQNALNALEVRENKLNELSNQVVSYKELQDENATIKLDLRNLAMSLRKTQLDRDQQQQSQVVINQKVNDIGSRYLSDNVKWIGKTLNANNFIQCKERLQDVVERCRAIGFPISAEEEAGYIADLRVEYEKAVRAEFEREEQARIKAQIREEQKLEREIQREQARLERERIVLQEALARALSTAADIHSAEIESLKARLAEAEAKERAISQAQLTKAGFVYVISNIGSFGDGVFKVGMTRRLEPKDRVRELGDASVPFPFDIHMMVSCNNAPALEHALHRALYKKQLNRLNPRKEFFRVDIESIAKVVRDNHGEIEYVADAEALQYRQSLAMSDEDLEYVEEVYEDLEGEDESFSEDLSQPVAQ